MLSEYTRLVSHESNYRNDINLVALNMRGCKVTTENYILAYFNFCTLK